VPEWLSNLLVIIPPIMAALGAGIATFRAQMPAQKASRADANNAAPTSGELWQQSQHQPPPVVVPAPPVYDRPYPQLPPGRAAPPPLPPQQRGKPTGPYLPPVYDAPYPTYPPGRY
jgi:hypothetical protein